MSRARLHPAGYDIGPAGAVTWQPSDSYLPPIIIGYAHTAADRARMAAAVLAAERARRRRAALDRIAGYGACALAVFLAVALFYAY